MKKYNLFLICLVALITISSSSCTKDGQENDNCENISGIWKGVYICAQGETNVTMNIEQDQCELSTKFDFSESPNNPGVPSGSARLIGSIDNNGQFNLTGSEWIDQPAGWIIADILGTTTNSKSNIQVTICGNTTVLTLQ
jgi:hypothetical protein